MNSRKLRKLTTILLAFTLLFLVGCTETEQAAETDGAYVEGTIAGEELGTAYAADAIFSLNSCAADGFNPYTTKNDDNRLVDELVYENSLRLTTILILPRASSRTGRARKTAPTGTSPSIPAS
jgi:hypothetical protein